MANGQPNSVLSQLVAALNAGRIRVVDLTQPLGPQTPVIGLPPIFAPSPGLTLTEISRYDGGAGLVLEHLHLGEHTGTHFDAPVHWITGKDLPDNRRDTIPPRRFIGPACVIDVTAEVAQNHDFLLTPGARPGVGGGARAYPGGRMGAAAYRLEQAHEPRGLPQRRVRRRALAGVLQGMLRASWRDERDVLGVGVETVGTDAGQAGTFDPPFPNHSTMHGAGKFGLTSLINLDQLPATGAVVIAAPLKIAGGSGSPLRVIALVPA